MISEPFTKYQFGAERTQNTTAEVRWRFLRSVPLISPACSRGCQCGIDDFFLIKLDVIYLVKKPPLLLLCSQWYASWNTCLGRMKTGLAASCWIITSYIFGDIISGSLCDLQSCFLVARLHSRQEIRLSRCILCSVTVLHNRIAHSLSLYKFSTDHVILLNTGNPDIQTYTELSSSIKSVPCETELRISFSTPTNICCLPGGTLWKINEPFFIEVRGSFYLSQTSQIPFVTLLNWNVMSSLYRCHVVLYMFATPNIYYWFLRLRTYRRYNLVALGINRFN